MSDVPTIRVVSAEIQRHGRWLIVQRPAKAVLPLLWEFPGGKVREGESDTEALRRNVSMRLGVTVEVGAKLMEVRHDYQGYSLTLAVYRADMGAQEPAHLKVAAHAWVTHEEMAGYPFPGADQQSVDKLIGELE